MNLVSQIHKRTSLNPLTIKALTAVFVIVSSGLNAQIHNPVFRTTPASCHEICDGSVALELDRKDPDVGYFWKSTSDNQYRPLSSNFLLGLCPGQYRIRKVKANQESLEKSSTTTTLDGFEPMSAFVINTLGKREVSLQLRFDRLLNNMNFYVQARYSKDKGVTWRNSSQLHQVSDVNKAAHVYGIEFPRSYENEQEVIIEFFKRKSEVEEQVGLEITEAYFLSKTFEEYSFEIAEKETIHVESTISNETDGGDGYIYLNVTKGTPPYMFNWNGIKGDGKLSKLEAGQYESRVTDSKGCSVTSHFLIEAPESAQKAPEFSLVQLNDTKIFQLKVSNIYRQMIELRLLDSLGKEVKEFRINPLYEDLEIDLKLIDLPSGSYKATLSTEVFSKNLDLQVK